MPKSRHRKKEYQPLYLVTGRWLERTAARFGRAASHFWHDLTLERGSRYYRALAVFCVLCLVLGTGVGIAWRSSAVRLAVERYRAVFLGEGDAPPVTPPDTTTEPTPPEGEPVEPSGSGSGGAGGPGQGEGAGEPTAPAEPSTPTEPSQPVAPPAAPKPDLHTVVRPVTGPTILAFGWQYSTTLADWRYHDGVDIQAAEGTTVRAILGGSVTEVDDSFDLGLYCVIDSGGGVETVYGSLKTCAAQVGQQVKQGAVIGSVGVSATAEAASGPHLHLELWDAGEAVDPEQYWQ